MHNPEVDTFLFSFQYFPDRFVKREINSLEMICEYHHDGCFWEGKFAEYEPPLKICEFSASHEKKCPLAPFSCSVQHSMVQGELDNHVKENAVEHLSIIASRLQLFEEVINSPKLLATKRVDADGGYHTMDEDINEAPPEVSSV